MKTLEQCIAMVESGGDTDAFRFEPSLYATYPAWVGDQLDKIMVINKCSRSTARMIACTSWGKYQLLGANVYALGYKNNILDFVWDQQDEQNEYFNLFIKGKGFSPDEDMSGWADSRYAEFATLYNGPGDVTEYVMLMKENAK